MVAVEGPCAASFVRAAAASCILAKLVAALGSPSTRTVLRKLKQLDTLSSYSHGGQYNTLRATARFTLMLPNEVIASDQPCNEKPSTGTRRDFADRDPPFAALASIATERGTNPLIHEWPEALLRD